MVSPTISIREFKRVYYDRTNDYWDIADTWGVARWIVDDWRRAFRLPSRRIAGTFRQPDDPEWDDPTPRHNYYSGRVSQSHWWNRRHIPPRGLTVITPPRIVDNERWYLVQ